MITAAVWPARLGPQLSLSDVHAALAYYLDHREEIERQAREDEDFVSQMSAAAGPSKLEGS